MARLGKCAQVLVVIATALVGTAQATPDAPAASGELDASFAGYGTGGRVLGQAFPGTIIRDSIALPEASFPGSPGAGGAASAERLIAAGSDGADFVVARYLADGALDPGFGVGGVMRVDFLNQPDFATAVALAPGGKLLVAGYTGGSGPFSQTDFAIARLMPDGSLDTSFDGDGRVTIDFHGGRDAAYWVMPAYTANGTSVLAGGSAQETPTTPCAPVCNHNIALVRLNDNGSPDNVFDGDGKVEVDLGASEESAAAFQQAFYPGKVYVVGTRTSATSEFVIALLGPYGLLDAGFGGDGVVTGPTPSVLVDVIPAGASDLVALGLAGDDLALVRVDAAGNLVSSFGTAGVQVQDLGGVDGAGALLALADGSLLAAGSSDARLALAKFTDMGQLMPGGLAVTELAAAGAETASAYSLQRLHDVRLWTLGSLQAGGTTRPVLTRHFDDLSADAGGRQVTGFGRSGADPLSNSPDRAYEAAFQPDGKLLVVGDTFLAGMSQTAGAVTRYQVDGTLDQGFGLGGGLILTRTQQLLDVRVQPDTRIAVVGTGFDVARMNPDGSPDLSFSGDGWTTAGFAGAFSSALALQPDGKLLAAGFHTDSNDLLTIAVARFAADGALDLEFGVGGRLRTDLGLNAAAMDVAVQPDGKIVVAGATWESQSDLVSHDFALVRFNPNGSLDTSFNGNGKLTTDFGAYEHGGAVVIQPDGKIVVAGLSIPAGMVLARYNPDGSLDNSFDRDGKLTIPSAGQEFLADLALDGSRLVSVACGPSAQSGWVLRLTAAGELDESFNGTGRARFQFGSGDCPSAVAVSLERIAAAGYAAAELGGSGDFAVALYERGAVLPDAHRRYLPLALRQP
jgi:uncharacterized delta-60 repeat protein